MPFIAAARSQQQHIKAIAKGEPAAQNHGHRMHGYLGERTPAAFVLDQIKPDVDAGRSGNIDQMATIIESNPEFSCQLDRTPRVGTRNYPRYRDAMTQCFKAGRYQTLKSTNNRVRR